MQVQRFPRRFSHSAARATPPCAHMRGLTVRMRAIVSTNAMRVVDACVPSRLWREDVAVEDERERRAQRLAQELELVPLSPVARPIVAPPRVDSQRGDTRILDHSRKLQRRRGAVQ
eukprot:616881-Pleurochrysis_carterae.AAC.2